MPARKHNIRLVNVRFTVDQYEALANACDAGPFRSLSELSRTAFRQRLGLAEADQTLPQNEEAV